MQPGRMVARDADTGCALELRALRAGRVRLWVEASLTGPVLELGLLEPAGMERLLARCGGAPGRGTTAVLELPGRAERLQLRALRRGGALARLRSDRLLRLTRPLEELRVTARLAAAGAPVARPALVVARRCGSGWRAALGTLYEEATQDGVRFLRSRPGRARLLRGVAAAARALRRFHDAGGLHADLHAGNLLLREGAAGTEGILVDLDRARLGAPPGPRRRMAELMRLYRSLCKHALLESVGRGGCQRFLDVYTRGDRELRRSLLAHLPRERARLRLHALAWRRGPAGRQPGGAERGALAHPEPGPLSHWQGMGAF